MCTRCLYFLIHSTVALLLFIANNRFFIYFFKSRSINFPPCRGSGNCCMSWTYLMVFYNVCHNKLNFFFCAVMFLCWLAIPIIYDETFSVPFDSAGFVWCLRDSGTNLAFDLDLTYVLVYAWESIPFIPVLTELSQGRMKRNFCVIQPFFRELICLAACVNVHSVAAYRYHLHCTFMAQWIKWKHGENKQQWMG